MEKGIASFRRIADRILMYSGTTSQINSIRDHNQSQTPANIGISMAEISQILAKTKGTRSLQWKTENGPWMISIYENLLAPTASESLLSIRALASKNIEMLLSLGKDLFFDLYDDFRIIVSGSQHSNDLYYISDRQVPIETSPSGKDVSAVTTMKSVIYYQFKALNSLSTGSHGTKKAVSSKSSLNIINKKAEEKLCHMCFVHSLTLTSVRGYLSKGILPQLGYHRPELIVCTKENNRRSFRGSLTAADLVDGLHFDTKGQLNVTSDDVHRFFMTIVEEYSRYTHFLPLKSK